MDASVISALSALGGAAIGGLTSGAMSWLTQEVQAKAQESAQDKSLRQQLHREFIEEASKSYGDAPQHSNVDVSSLVGLYAKISRMRVLSPTAVTERADQVMRMIVETYMAPNNTVPELRDLMIQGKLDALSDFSEACRMELGRSAPQVLGPVPPPSRPEWQTGGVLPDL
jgi:hypothetical protein